MRINKRYVRNVEHYLATVPDGSSFRVIFETSDLRARQRAGFHEDAAAGSTILPAIVGPVSRFNAEGAWKLRRDRPKESRYVRTVRWSWKQWAGRDQTEEHEDFRDIYRDCYPRDQIDPPSTELTFLKSGGRDFVVSEVLTKDGTSRERAKHIINLFLELFGSCEIVGADLVSLPTPVVKKVNWRMLPPGEHPWPKLEKHIEEYYGSRSSDGLLFIKDRQATIREHGPDEIYVGDGGFSDYVAYRFRRLGLVVMESIRRDNAIYVFGEDWAKVSKLTKAEVLSNQQHKARIIHAREWKARLASLLSRPLAA